MNTTLTTALDSRYIAERLAEQTGKATTITSSRFINSPLSGRDRYHAVAQIGDQIVSGEGKTINELISNINERYEANA